MSAFSYVIAALILFCPIGGDQWWDRPDDETSDPIISFVQPAESTALDEPLAYGSIRVEALDPDAGSQDGSGIDRVGMVVIDLATGDVVAARSEYWSTYDFGPSLPDGDYEFVATAYSSWWAGGTSSTASIEITIDTAPPTTAPSTTTTTAPPPTTAPPTTTAPPPTTAPPATTAPPTTAPPTTAPPTTVPPTTAPPTTAPLGEIERANARSLELLNGLRSQQALGQLESDPTMAAFAADWSATMPRSGFRHSDGPYAENIVWYSDDSMTPEEAAAQFHDAWVNSPGHYANMTNPRWTLVGVGLYRDESGWWGTHVFR